MAGDIHQNDSAEKETCIIFWNFIYYSWGDDHQCPYDDNSLLSLSGRNVRVSNNYLNASDLDSCWCHRSPIEVVAGHGSPN